MNFEINFVSFLYLNNFQPNTKALSLKLIICLKFVISKLCLQFPLANRLLSLIVNVIFTAKSRRNRDVTCLA